MERLAPAWGPHGGEAERLASLGLLDWGRELLPEHFRAPAVADAPWLADELDAWHADARPPRERHRAARRGQEHAGHAGLSAAGGPGAAGAVHLDRLRHAAAGLPAPGEHQDGAAGQPAAAARPIPAPPAAVRSGGKGRSCCANGVAIEAFGTLQRMRGRRRRRASAHADRLRRPAERSARAVGPPARADAALVRRRLLKAGDGRTNILNLATALHRDALALELARTPGWRSRTFRAIEQWPTNMQLWEQWEAIYANVEDPLSQARAREFYESHREQMDAGAVLLWPEREDLYALMCLQAEGGRTAFAREKQGSPLSPDVCEWPESYFHGRTCGSTPGPRACAIKVLALDPSKGRDARRGDYSAYVLLGIDRQGLVYVEADLARRPTPQMVADGVALYRRFRPEAFGLEANQFQELLAGEFEAEFRRQGVHGVRPWLMENSVNKLVRIRRLSPLLAAGRLRFKRSSPSARSC